MRILLISNSYAPEPTGIGHYNGELAEELVRRGHQFAVVCANPSYPYWKLFGGFPKWRWTRRREAGVSIVRSPLYVPAEVTGLKRIIHYASFAASAAVPALAKARSFKPDVVLCVVPTLMAAPVALLAARIAGAVSWLHVQDFEVEAGFATGQMRGEGLAAKAALRFERGCIAAFDVASSISPEMCAKLVEKGRDPAAVVEVRNWADIDTVVPRPHSIFRDRWNIATRHVALYSGSIAKKQGIDTIIDAASLLKDRGDITFIICGNGPTRAELERSAADLPNFRFYDLQPKEELGELLNLATIHLLPQKRDAADLVLPSKLTNMLASGRPVVAGTALGRGLTREVEGCGLAVEPEDPAVLAAGIVRLIEDDELYARCAAAARRRAVERWSRTSIIDSFERALETAKARRRRGRP